MQKRVTVTERREGNQGLCVLSAQGREKGSFFCGLTLAQQRCPAHFVPHRVVRVIRVENPLGNTLE